MSGLILGAFALSLIHPWSHAYVGNAQYGDAAYWDFAGESWARGYLAAKAPDIRPGYSVFLGIVYSLTQPAFQNAFVAQALLYAIGVALVYAIGRSVGGRFVGLVAGVLLMLDPYMWEWTATSTTELLGSILNLGALFALVAVFSRRRHLVWAAAFGALLAAANVVRPVTLPFLGPALLLLLLARTPLRARVLTVAIALAATFVALLPSVAYQLASTGDPGLSSNGAANLFAASSPKYGVWSPAIYDDVAAQLTARGIPATAANINSEFVRLTIRNYIDFPEYQARRIAREFRDYAAFEGELERPEQYTFYRPVVVALGGLLACLVALLVRPRLLLWTGPVSALVAAAALKVPLAMLAAAQALAVLASLRGVVQRDRRSLALLAVAAFWATTGLAAIITAGISGFFLNRLYTQVEPERAVLLAAALGIVVVGPFARRFGRARLMALAVAVRTTPRLPGAARLLPWIASGVLVGAVCLGGTRLVLANAVPTATSAFNVPSETQLAELGQQLQLPTTPTYVDDAALPETRTKLVSGGLPSAPIAYAFPGEFTRFLWFLPDQNRTLFWFVPSQDTRPAALDRNLLTGEAMGNLQAQEFANRLGLLIVVPTSAYFDATGDVSLQNVLAVRAFVPWDPQVRAFQMNAPLAFPLATPLYDHTRFQGASRSGTVTVVEAGAVRVASGDRLERALSFAPDPASTPLGGGTREASIRYPDVWLPPAGRFQAWISLHPRLFGHSDLGPVHVEVGVTSGTTYTRVGGLDLDATDPTQRAYGPVDLPLPSVDGARADLSITVRQDTGSSLPAEVLVGEPRVVLP